MIVILMGVAGSGKTTVGRLLADRLGWPFYDGDDFHPDANLAKMARGLALDDEDRQPWLERLARLVELLDQKGQSAVMAVSALKRAYRTQLRFVEKNLEFVFLQGGYETIQKRLQARQDHFFDQDLLADQFRTLELPSRALTVSIEAPPNSIVDTILGHLQSASGRRGSTPG